MTYFLYSVFDKLMNFYNVPVCSVSDSVAARDFENACMVPNNPFVKHPEDYTLMLIASLDMITGEVTPIEPTPICRASDFSPKLIYDSRKE